MSENHRIRYLADRFSRNACTPDELREFQAYLEKGHIGSGFPYPDDLDLTAQPELEQESADAIFTSILQTAKLQEQKRHTRKRRRILFAAASVLVVALGCGWLFWNADPLQNTSGQPIVPSNRITLQTGDGKIQVLSTSGASAVTNSQGTLVANRQQDMLSYQDSGADAPVEMHTLRIPYGHRFRLLLTDGTLVHLNAGTTFTFPSRFAEATRTVSVDGEAYFEVAKDKSHPFIVKADELNVGVLGTHFNVSDYEEDDRAEAVLVEGSVCLFRKGEIFDANRNFKIKPGEKGSLDRTTKSLSRKNVSTAIYTSWTRGELYFNDLSFARIAKKLERRFNVVIEIRDAKLAQQHFTASFKDEPVEKILGYFNEIHPMRYRIQNQKLIITAK